MRFFSEEALILDVRDLQDRDRVVTFLTRDRGKRSGVAQGARRKHSRFAGQLQPLAKVKMSFFEKEGRDLVRISGADLLRPAAKLQEDLEGILLGSYLVDHLLVFVQENEPGELFYRLLDSTLEALLQGVDRDLGARYFEAWVLRLAGIYPVPSQCPHCGAPLLEGAALPPGAEGLLCFECAGGQRGFVAGPELVELLRRMGRESLGRLAERPPEAGVLRQAEQLACRVRRSFLQHELKSYQVIERMRMEV